MSNEQAATRPEMGFVGNSIWSAWVYLARHGRTELNAAGALRGHIDVPLDGVGRAQVARLGKALASKSPRVVVSSPLLRAIETAEAIAHASGADVVIDKRLIDRDYGPLAGQRTDDVVRQWGSPDAAPGVEPMDEVLQRTLQAFRDIVSGAIGSAVVIVAHDVVNRALLSALDPVLGELSQVPQETGCFNTIECFKEGTLPVRYRVIAINQVPSGPEVQQADHSGASPGLAVNPEDV